MPLSHEVVGRSAEGRELLRFTRGQGPVQVLLWSQIHGDEPTGTMILVDLLHALETPDGDVARGILDKLTLHILPMLNPDGAERFVRTNAQGLDPNRDARAWTTPEARALRDVFGRVRPQFALDLHDQDPRKRVGDSDRFIAYSVLAPKAAEQDDDSKARTRSKQLACVAYNTLSEFVHEHLARYPETFEPRGLEEFMQADGTSVVLLETGGWKGDLEKQYLRKAGYAAVIAMLRAIADESYANIPTADYDKIPENGDPVHDLLLRDCTVTNLNVDPFVADIAMNFAAPLERCGGKVADIGDLSDEHAFEVIDCKGLFIRHSHGERVEKDIEANFEILSSIEEGDLIYIIEDGRVLRDADNDDI